MALWSFLSSLFGTKPQIQASAEVNDSSSIIMTPSFVMPDQAPLITGVQLRQITTRLPEYNLNLYAQCISDACSQFEITDNIVLAMWLGQVAHETGGFIWLTELASGQAYEGRRDLGNTQPGDGQRFKGRGMIQVTGRANYQAASKALGHDFISNPTDLSQPKWAALSAAWFWNQHGLTTKAKSGTVQAFQACTKVINGGLNGESDREMYWGKAKTALGIVN